MEMNDVWVEVVGTQVDATGIADKIEFASVGKHYYKNGLNYILYDDSQMDGVKTMLKFDSAKLTLVRRGAVSQEHDFIKDACSVCEYRTPYGSVTMAITTNDIKIDYALSAGDIAIDYSLEINGRWQSQNHLSIKVYADKARSNYCQ